MEGKKSGSAAMTISIALNLVLVIALVVLLNAYTQLQNKYERSNEPQQQNSAVDIGGYEQNESDFIPGASFEPEMDTAEQQSYQADILPAGTLATQATTTAQTTAKSTTTTTVITEAQTTASTIPTAVSADENEDAGEWLDIWSDE